MKLRRTGPFLPPISFPWGPSGTRVVVSDDVRKRIESEGFEGISFREVVKEKIVRLDWHLWDLAAGKPQWYPENGEPQEYLDGPHEPKTAGRMPNAWELLPPVVGVRYEEIEESQHEEPPLQAVLERRDNPAWFRTRSEFGDMVLAVEPRRFLQNLVGEWVTFEPLRWRFA